MQGLKKLVEANEDWLVDRMISYAKRFGYTENSSTLKEAWRASIAGLNHALFTAFTLFRDPPVIRSGEDFTRHPITIYGIEQARQHRARGITLVDFLGLFKHCHQTYCDLIDEKGHDLEDTRRAQLFVDRFFDLVEIGFCEEWRSVPQDDKLKEVQQENRRIINEKNKYLTIFESLKDPVVLLDSERRIQNMNLAAQTLFFDHSAPGAIYYSAENGTQYVPRRETELEELIRLSRDKTNFQMVLRTADGPRHFYVGVQNMLDISEKFLGTVLICNDISEHERAREAAEADNKAKSAFLATMSHEIRTPLNGILGLADLLNDTRLTERQSDYVNGIRSSSKVLRSVLNDVLDYSKIEAGAIEVELADFELETLLGQVEDSVNATVISKKLKFETNIDASVPHILRSDPIKVCQILINLVGNAVKFTEQGTIDVSIRSELTGSAPTIRFEVRDDGIGIGSVDKKKLFEAFTQQAEARSKLYHGGTGLGLAICNKLVQALGGEIDCEPKPERGSLFWFSIPYFPALGVDLQDRDTDKQPTVQRDLKILLVEDNPVNRMVTEGYLSTLSHQFVSVENGVQALDAIGARQFDLILMDDRMPVMTGREVLETLRRHSDAAIAKIPVIIHSACTTNEEVEKAFSCGATGFLSKPFSCDDLAYAINDCMSNEPGAKLETPVFSENETPGFLQEGPLNQHLNALGHDAAERIVNAYLTSSSELVDEIRLSRESRQFDALERAAHSLKGACGTVGLSYMADLAGDLEQAAHGEEGLRASYLAEKICNMNGLAAEALRKHWTALTSEFSGPDA